MKISLDIEGTIADIHTPTFRALREKHNDKSISADVSWDLGNSSIDIVEFLEVAKEIWYHSPSVINLKDNKVPQTVSAIRNRHSLDLVTSRTNCENPMKQWLEEKNIEYNNFIIKEDKSELDYDIFIDDSPKLAEKVDNIILYDNPWNKCVDDSKIICRIGDGLKEFSDLPEIIESLDLS